MSGNGAWLALGVAGAAAMGAGASGRGSANRVPVVPLAALGLLAGGALYALSRRRASFEVQPSTPEAPAATVPQAAATGPQPPATPASPSAGKKYINPIASSPYRVSSPYGYRTHPITGKQHLHGGIDLAAREGTPVYAVEGGVVSKVWADHPQNGNAVKVQHPDGWSTAYLHMVDPPTLGVGQAVAKGQQVGRVGSTGSATGPHLHFMTYKPDGQTTDPATVTDLSPWSPASAPAPAMV